MKLKKIPITIKKKINQTFKKKNKKIDKVLIKISIKKIYRIKQGINKKNFFKKIMQG
jgi:hypothetical protein